MTPPRLNRITVFYLPSLKIPPETFETTGRAGYRVHADGKNVLGFRIWCDGKTTVIPKDHVQKIVAELPVIDPRTASTE